MEKLAQKVSDIVDNLVASNYFHLFHSLHLASKTTFHVARQFNMVVIAVNVLVLPGDSIELQVTTIIMIIFNEHPLPTSNVEVFQLSNP